VVCRRGEKEKETVVKPAGAQGLGANGKKPLEGWGERGTKKVDKGEEPL